MPSEAFRASRMEVLKVFDFVRFLLLEFRVNTIKLSKRNRAWHSDFGHLLCVKKSHIEAVGRRLVLSHHSVSQWVCSLGTKSKTKS